MKLRSILELHRINHHKAKAREDKDCELLREWCADAPVLLYTGDGPSGVHYRLEPIYCKDPVTPTIAIDSTSGDSSYTLTIDGVLIAENIATMKEVFALIEKHLLT